MSQLFPYLLILVCPITMGLMMWLMMKGMGQDKQPDPRVAELESQLNDLRSAVGRVGLSEPVEPPLEAPTVNRV